MQFAKLFEIDNEQVLFYREPDHDAEDDREKLHQVVYIDGVCIDMAVGGMTYELGDTAFDKVDQDYARQILANARKLLSGLT